MREPRRNLWLGLVAIAAAGLLASCQAVFTFSPLSFLRRDPSTLSVAQQVEFAASALGSGDAEALAEAYAAIEAAAAADPLDPDLQYLAAQLALEMSGVGGVFETLLAGGGDLVIDATVWEGINQDLLADAGLYLQTADTLDADLTSTDYLVGAVGLLVAGAVAGTDVVATAGDNENQDEAVNFLSLGIAELTAADPSDPAIDILQALLDSVN